MAGGEARPYDVCVGNTHPGSTEEIIRSVLQKAAQGMLKELKLQEPLEILEVECLKKTREDGRTREDRRRIWTKFKEHMLRPEAFPDGWTSRRYFPPRAQRTPVADLDPPEKRANLQNQE